MRSTKGHVEPMSPREAVGICGRAPEEDGPGHCGEHTGAGADPGAAGGETGGLAPWRGAALTAVQK